MIVVHRQQLLDQWRERLAMFLDLPVDEIGQVGAGKTKRTGKIDVAVIQSLYHRQGALAGIAPGPQPTELAMRRGTFSASP